MMRKHRAVFGDPGERIQHGAFAPGLRSLPRELGTKRGLPWGSKNLRRSIFTKQIADRSFMSHMPSLARLQLGSR